MKSLFIFFLLLLLYSCSPVKSAWLSLDDLVISADKISNLQLINKK